MPITVTTLSDTITQHRAGGIRIVAVASAARSQFLPDVPTLKESGVDLNADGWYGMWLPAGSSPEFAKKLSVAVAEVLAKPEVKEKLLAVTLIPVGSTPEELAQAARRRQRVLAADREGDRLQDHELRLVTSRLPFPGSQPSPDSRAVSRA